LVLVDSHLDVPLSAGLFKIKRPIWIYCALPQLDAPDAQAAAKTRAQTLKISQLQQLGAEVVCLPNQAGKVDLLAMLQDLGRRQINELHVEAGFKLNGSLANAGLINEWLIYLAPLLLGEGMGIAKILPPTSLQAARRLALQSITPLGQDLRVLARTH
jgi:diaminohydroxyphosphoribosylaminopyrimidine deaminase/5-amino-6-(5-phosphoribosylamino)uracil reductase